MGEPHEVVHEEFQVHMLNEEVKHKATFIANAFTLLLNELMEVCPISREFSIVKTKLEEASFFAKKAMAKQPENQQSASAGS
jgi:hypothetical protein